MTPRPLYKWKSFWLGILVLGFLGWAWRDSGHHRSYAGWSRGPQDHEVFMAESRIGWVGTRYVNGRTGDSISYYREEMKFGFEFPEALSWRIDFHAFIGGVREVKVAHWFLLLLFLVPWSAFLAWRWRRQRILTKTNPLS